MACALAAEESRSDGDATAGRSGRRRWQVALAVVALLALGNTVAGCIAADQIRTHTFAVDRSPDSLRYDVHVVDAADREVTYRRSGSANSYLVAPGRFGLAWPGGFAIVGEVASVDGDLVTRPIEVEAGRLRPGTDADLIGAVWPSDPMEAFGIPFRDVEVPGELGPLPAWYVPAASDRWAIVVHGKSTPRFESLRMLPVLHDAGLQALVISYRGDPDVAADPSGRYQYGTTEYRDVESAIEYATDRGAQQLVLVGYSMGGATAVQTLLRSARTDGVVGVVLDAPVLDLEAAVDLVAHRTSVAGLPVPGSVLATGKWMLGWRDGIDWAALDLVARASELTVPILVLHGTEDEMVPIASSEALAAARPDLVRLERFDGAGHVLAWNVDPPRYERAVADFLAEHCP